MSLPTRAAIGDQALQTQEAPHEPGAPVGRRTAASDVEQKQEEEEARCCSTRGLQQQLK